jgi:hypothetical protein
MMRYEGHTDERCAACRKGDKHSQKTHERFLASHVAQNRPRMPERKRSRRAKLDARASRAEQAARLIDCGPSAWDES